MFPLRGHPDRGRQEFIVSRLAHPGNLPISTSTGSPWRERADAARIGRVTVTQYLTATTLDGFIADAHNSLDWLFHGAAGRGRRAALGGVHRRRGGAGDGRDDVRLGPRARGPAHASGAVAGLLRRPALLGVHPPGAARDRPASTSASSPATSRRCTPRWSAAARAATCGWWAAASWSAASTTPGSSTRCGSASRRSRSARGRRCCPAGSRGCPCARCAATAVRRSRVRRRVPARGVPAGPGVRGSSAPTTRCH